MREMKYTLPLFCSVFCAGAIRASTIAYWPMNVSGTGDSRVVTDTTSNYDLTVRSSSFGAPTFVDNDIGWTLPPNPDDVGNVSTQVLVSSVGSKDSASKYRPLLSSANTTLCQTLSAFHDFTVEGWCRLSEPPDEGGFCFAINNTGLSGGWVWKLQKPAEDGRCKCRVEYNYGEKTRLSFDTKVHKDELLDRWNHYAIVCVASATEDKCEWRFYLNGRLRGSEQFTKPSSTGSWAKATFCISGVESGTAQQIVGKLLCWRASNAALDKGQFLCDVRPAGTVAYWPMSPITVGTKSFVPSATGPDYELSLRSASLGDVEVLANDIGWTEPANPDPQADKSAVWTSDKTLGISTGAKSDTGTYLAVLSSTSGALDAALSPTNDFCIEGWYCATNLPASSSANHMFVCSTYSWYGGWVWNIYGADESGKCAVKVSLEAGKKDGSTASSRQTYKFVSLASSDVLNKWNHYALGFDSKNNVWKFYFNGVLVGAQVGKAISDMPSRTPQIYMFGVHSGTAQIPQGKLTTWRVSRGKFTPARFLCGDMTAANSYTWTGAATTTWSTGADANWKDADGTACAWKNYWGAIFDGSAAVTLSGEVMPSAITVKGDQDVSIAAASKSYIGTACEEIVKEGAGTLLFSGNGIAINKSSNRIRVKGGTLRVTNPNNAYSLGDATAGYAAFVHGGATLAVDQRNALGSSDLATPNRNRFVVYTNGVFDLSCPSDTFNIQAISCLDLAGGSLVLPDKGHAGGCLEIRDHVSFGLNPGSTPYVFTRASTAVDTHTWKYGTNTEFAVANVTGDDEPDVTFDNHVLAMKTWQDATGACCFRKTGDGTMVLRQQRTGYSTSHVCYPTGVGAVNTVEAGELRIDCDYTGPSFDVASGAFLSGTGVVSAVSFAAGAGMKGVLGDPSCLRIAGDCTIVGTGVAALRAKNPSHRRVKLATVAGNVVGAENLKNWTVSIDGTVQKDYFVALIGQDLVAKTDSGLILTVR